MSIVTQALRGFRSEPFNWNCYQSILSSYNKLVKEGKVDPSLAKGKDLDMMEEIGKSYGHGRHPTGRCGSLQAVLDLLPPEEHEWAMNEFKNVATYTDCEDIRGEDTIPCNRCVETSGTILSKYLGKTK